MNVINFAITIGLGVISLALSIFAIWLSKHFEAQSSAALEKIKELTGEIRTLSGASLNQQQTFSTKMLDSILASGPYGTAAPKVDPSKATEELIRAELAETETRIIRSIEARVKEVATNTTPDDMRSALADIRNSIGQLSKEAATTVAGSTQLPDRLRALLYKYREYPAFFPLLAAILREGASSVANLSVYDDKYHFAQPFEVGVDHLLGDGILEGSAEKFSVKEEYRRALAAWVDANWLILRRIIAFFKNRPKEGDKASLVEVRKLAAALAI